MQLPSLPEKEALILQLLVEESDGLYGLEMVHSCEGLKRGTVYVTLRRMSEKGLVEATEEDRGEEGGLPRKVYTVTHHGLQVWKAHQAARRMMNQDEAWAT